MNPILRPLLLCSALIAVPLVQAADAPAPAAAASTLSSLLAGFSSSQLSDGLKSGLGTALESTLAKLTQPGTVTVAPPKALAKLDSATAASTAAGSTTTLSGTISDAVAKVMPQAAGIMGDLFKDVKIDDAKAVLTGGPTAGTQYLQKTMGPALRTKLLPVVTTAVASSGVEDKAKSLLAAAGPFASLAGGKSVSDIDGYICDQVIAQSFQLLGKQETAIRANPSLLTNNPLAQKIFAAVKK